MNSHFPGKACGVAVTVATIIMLTAFGQNVQAQVNPPLSSQADEPEHRPTATVSFPLNSQASAPVATASAPAVASSPAPTTASPATTVTPWTRSDSQSLPSSMQAQSDVSPAPAIGDSTRSLLQMQADSSRPGTPHHVLGATAGMSWQRYLDSFGHEIPEWFENEVESGRSR